MKKTLQFLCFFMCGLLLFSATALAYVDPSAMTYMIQLVAGIVIAAGAAFGFYFRKLKRMFSKFGKKESAAGSRADSRWEDDDDTGYQDYEIEPAGQTAADVPAAAVSNAPVAFGASDRTDPAAAGSAGPGAGAAPGIIAVAAVSGQTPALAQDDLTALLPADEYDENGGEAGLLAENRMLRRLLAEERAKVEVLKQSLHICTEPKK